MCGFRKLTGEEWSEWHTEDELTNCVGMVLVSQFEKSQLNHLQTFHGWDSNKRKVADSREKVLMLVLGVEPLPEIG
jgi:hypothetical protein